MNRPALVLTAITASLFIIPLLFPSDPMVTSPAEQMQPPRADHLLGTDLLGRDILSRTLYGGQRTIVTAVLATATAIFPGTAIGLTTGWGRERASRIILVVMNAFLAVPGLLLALVVVTVLGRGIPAIIAAVGISQIIPCGFVIRAAVLNIRTTTYVEAARAAGGTPWHNITNHILPNILPTLGAYTGVIFAYCVLNGAALSFLGLGGEPGIPEWGAMLADARPLWRTAPWIGLAPGLAITLTVMSINRLVDSLSTFRR